MEAYISYSRNNALSAAIAPHQLVHPSYERLKTAIAEAHPATAEHSVKVRICATSLGIACKLTGTELTSLSIAAELHDIGKMRISLKLLDKCATLSESDWSLIKKHTIWGAQMAASSFPDRPEVAQCVLYHHERLDGSGYPNGLTDDQLTILPRIVSIADAFVAMTENRSFRAARDHTTALKTMIEDEKGKYDENILSLLARIV